MRRRRHGDRHRLDETELEAAAATPNIQAAASAVTADVDAATAVAASNVKAKAITATTWMWWRRPSQQTWRPSRAGGD